MPEMRSRSTVTLMRPLQGKAFCLTFSDNGLVMIVVFSNAISTFDAVHENPRASKKIKTEL
ncbi:hypothetical protein L208DRAFT_1403581, partial [Tricholoma matsutake]